MIGFLNPEIATSSFPLSVCNSRIRRVFSQFRMSTAIQQRGGKDSSQSIMRLRRTTKNENITGSGGFAEPHRGGMTCLGRPPVAPTDSFFVAIPHVNLQLTPPNMKISSRLCHCRARPDNPRQSKSFYLYRIIHPRYTPPLAD